MKQQRTRDKHRLLVASAADLLQDQGWTALTHRGLVARSGVPLASITYYFDGVDDLVAQAAAELARRHLEAGRALVDGVPTRRAGAARTARLVAAILVGADPTSQDVQALYERYLRAGRAPALRELVVTWNAEVHRLVAEVLRRTGHDATAAEVRLLVGALDGLIVTALAEGERDPVATAVRAAAALVPAPASRT